MAIPRADGVVYETLRQAVHSAVEWSVESPSLEFKRSAPWRVLKWKIIKTALAMANLAGGGRVIIGVSEAEDSWDLTGIEADHLETFDPDVISDQLQSFASPCVRTDLAVVRHSSGVDLLVMTVHEFEDVPVVCSRSSTDDELKEGAVYVRPRRGRPQTSIVMCAEDMHGLLRLAAEKRARGLIESMRRIGLPAVPSPSDAYSRELGDL